METVCFEMATYVSRTATTPILNQSNERNATILDWRGPPGGALRRDPPVHASSSTLPVRFSHRVLRRRAVNPGDVIVANDPYHGGGHLPDFNVFAPVFSDQGELLLIASIQCHHGDTGGAVAGGYNTMARDIYAEGTRYPLLKIIDGGQGAARRRADHAGQQPAGRLHRRPPSPGRRGPAGRSAARQELVRPLRTGRRPGRRRPHDRGRPAAVLEEIAGWPDGTYEADVYVDSDPQGNQDLHVHVAVTVDGRAACSSTSRDPTTAPDISAGRRSATPGATPSPSWPAWSTRRSPRTRGSSTASSCGCPLGCCLNPYRGQAREQRHPPSRASRWVTPSPWPCRRSSPSAAHPRRTSSAAPARCGATCDPRTGRAVLRPRWRGQCRMGQRGGGRRRLGGAGRGHGQPDQGRGRTQRAAVPPHPRGAATTSRTPVDPGNSGWLRQPLRQGGAHADLRKPVHRQPAPHPPRHRRGSPGSPDVCVAERGHRARGRRVAGRSPPTSSRPATSSSTTSAVGGGLGRPPRARAVEAVLEDVWDEYVSIDGARRRLRRRRHRARSRRWTSRSMMPPPSGLRAELHGNGGTGHDRRRALPDRRRRRWDLHRLRAAPPGRSGPRGKDADDTGGPVDRRAGRDSPDWPRPRGSTTCACAAAGHCESIVHGTTTADNTMIQMSGAPTGLLVTEGFRDEIEMRRCFKEDIWDPALPGARLPSPAAGCASRSPSA